MRTRSSGILMHISSLWGEFGIGDFGKGAYDFVDFLFKSKQRKWQVLPLGITGYGDSPYQSFSAFAGNPYFIDLNEFLNLGFLSKKDVKVFEYNSDEVKVDYGFLYKYKLPLIRKAYENASISLKELLENFYKANFQWLRDFSLFMSIKQFYGDKSWFDWDKDYRIYNSPQVLEFEKGRRDEMFFWIFTQYFFTKQWTELKEYANKKGIKIIGDLPLYIAEDSVDLWSKPYFFNLNKELFPITVAGTPPDSFAKKGQLWGNPTYKWPALEEDKYNWWIKRIRHSFTQFDILRLDHFRGFESYWEITYGDKDARKGKWIKGPGIGLFNKVEEELGDLNIIIEDLGYTTKGLLDLVEALEYPNMNVLQFAFNPDEESRYLPHKAKTNSVTYTGSHDNKTLKSWLSSLGKEEENYLKNYLNTNEKDELVWGVIKAAWSSNSILSIAPMQDFLELGKEARMNTPGTTRGNWEWRIKEKDLSSKLAYKICDLTQRYGR